MTEAKTERPSHDAKTSHGCLRMTEIKNHPRYFITPEGDVFSRRHKRLRKLKPNVGRRGYRCVDLDGHRRAVHRLVAMTFIPQPDSTESLCVRHKNGNPSNNHVDNLAWGTHTDNMRDRYSHGTMIFGEKNGRAVLSESDVIEIRRRRTAGEKLLSIAVDFGVSKVQVHRIVTGKSWPHSTEATWRETRQDSRSHTEVRQSETRRVI